jgi:hypothetical protein
MPKITEISEVLTLPNHCPFDSVAGVVATVYDWEEKQGKRGPYGIQNIELRDRTPGSTQRIKVFLMGQPPISKESKGQQILFTTGGKPDSLARADNDYQGKTTLQLTVKGGSTWCLLRDGVPVSPTPPAQPPSQPQQRHQEAPNDQLAGDPTPQAQTHAQRPSTAQGDVSVTIPTAAQAIAQVKEGMKRPALAILLCLEEVDVICVARFRRLVEKLNKAEPGSSEASYTNQLLKEEDEPNPELRIELLRSLLIQGGQSGLWDLLPLVSLDKKPTPPPAEAPAPVSAPPVAPAQPAPAKATKPQLPSHGQPGYNIDQDAPF